MQAGHRSDAGKPAQHEARDPCWTCCHVHRTLHQLRRWLSRSEGGRHSELNKPVHLDKPTTVLACSALPGAAAAATFAPVRPPCACGAGAGRSPCRRARLRAGAACAQVTMLEGLRHDFCVSEELSGRVAAHVAALLRPVMAAGAPR